MNVVLLAQEVASSTQHALYIKHVTVYYSYTIYNTAPSHTERMSSVDGQHFYVHYVGSLAAVNTEFDILWIATARHRHVQLTVAEPWTSV